MKELPETDDGVAQWCKDIFVAKVGIAIQLVLFSAALFCNCTCILYETLKCKEHDVDLTVICSRDWCSTIYIATSNCIIVACCHLEYQDALLDKHMTEDTFSDQELQDLGRPKKSLVVRYFILTSHV